MLVVKEELAAVDDGWVSMTALVRVVVVVEVVVVEGGW